MDVNLDQTRDYTKSNQKKMEYTFLKRCFQIFKLLDIGKRGRLINEDPPLFKPTSSFKAGRKTMSNFVVDWAVNFLGKESSILKHLKRLDYELEYEQKAIQEVNMMVTELSSDLTDGVKLGKLLEILHERLDILQHFRYNPGAKTTVPKMSREYNWRMILKACNKLKVDLSYKFNDDENRKLTNHELALGHQEQTLILVVRLMRHFRHKFMYPSDGVLEKIEHFVEIYLLRSPSKVRETIEKMMLVRENAATTIQKSWRTYKLQKYNTKKYLPKIVKIQSCLRICLAKKQLQTLKREKLSKLQKSSAIIIQSQIRKYLAQKRLKQLKLEKLQISAAIKIQSNFRRKLAEKELQVLKRERLENISALKIQCWARTISAIKTLKILKLEKLQATSALKIQCWWRQHLAGKKLAILKLEKLKTFSALKIQCFWRQKSAKLKLNRLKLEAAEKYKQQSAAIKIQYYIKSWLRKLQAEKLKRQQAQLAATIKIQSYYRALKAKKLAQELKYQQARLKAAIIIQSQFRSFIAKKIVAKIRAERNYTRCIIVIQSHIRRFLAEAKLKKLKTEFILKSRAAITIQKNFKSFLARKQLTTLKKEHLIKQNTAAIKITSVIKTVAAIKSYQRKLEDYNFAAIIIQANFRRHLAVKNFKTLQSQRHQAAIKIQSFAKVWLAKRELEKLKQEKLAQKAAVIKIIAVIKCVAAMKAYKRLLEDRNYAAVIIQSNFKRFLAVRKFQTAKIEIVAKLERKRQEKAAIIIQKVYKGFIVREKYLKLGAATKQRRKRLNAIFDEGETLACQTGQSLSILKAAKVSKAKIQGSLSHLLKGIKLLPEVQASFILDCGGLLYIKKFINTCNKSPQDIEICCVCITLVSEIFNYIKTSKDQNICLEILAVNVKNILLSYKYAYKQNKETVLLLQALTLFSKSLNSSWVVSATVNFTQHDMSFSEKEKKKFLDCYSTAKNIVENQIRFKQKPNWINNAKLLCSSMVAMVDESES